MKKMFLKSMIWVAFVLCFGENLVGQGFVKFYGQDEFNQTGRSIIGTSDNGFLLAGADYSDDLGRVMLVKTDSLGNEEWTTYIETPWDTNLVVKIEQKVNSNNYYIFVRDLPLSQESFQNKIYEIDVAGNLLSEQENDFFFEFSDITQTLNGDFIGLTSTFIDEPDDYDIFLIHFTDWVYTYHFGFDDVPSQVITTQDGGFLFSGYNGEYDESRPFLLKTNNIEGIEMWRREESLLFNRRISNITETQDSCFLVAMVESNFNSDLIFQKIAPNGELIWERNIGEINYDERIITLKEASNGDILILSSSQTPIPNGYFFMRMNAQGTLLHQTKISVLSGSFFYDLTETSDNGVAIIGEGSPILENNFQLVKIDSSGDIFTNQLHGNAFQDFNLNCEPNTNENGFSNQLIQADGLLDFYAFTDSLGNYSMLLDSGNYEIKLHSPNNHWQPCEDIYPINFPNFSDTIALNLPMNPVIDCPLLQVQLSNNTLRPCPLPNKIIVQYCNEGTTTAEAALLEVTLHEDMAVDSISVDPAAVAGDLYTFELGDLAPFDCGQITFHFQLECDSVQLGQTLCAEAHIYPDTLCLDPVWTGPVISVDGQCHPDSITFIIENEGDDMPDPQQYIIIEDNIILLQEPYQLLNGETEEITIPKADNATYFMLAEQSPDLPPVLGNNYATFAIENCEVLPLTGIFNQFPLDDAEPYFDELCRVVTGSYDPNDKQGFPTGFGDDHRIEQNVDLDYLIRFQNTGTDTAFTVVIRDNLSEFLDLTTLRPGASSHDYDLEIVNGRTLKFTFNNILLPDSTTNEPLSHGWVEFHIAQVADNPVGTLIENRADIYFDGNAPILTNTTEHLIWIDFIDILDETTQVFQEDVELKVYPNPAQEYAIFEIKNLDNADLTFKLFNSAGQLQRVDDFIENAYYFYRNGLTEGLYFYQIESEGALVVTGKLVLR